MYSIGKFCEIVGAGIKVPYRYPFHVKEIKKNIKIETTNSQRKKVGMVQ